GLHSQIEDLRIYFARPIDAADGELPNQELDFARAQHVVLGYDQRLGDVHRLKLELYSQHLLDVPVIVDSSFSMINFEQDFTFNERLINGGAGRNYGIELTLERFLQDGFYWLVTGSAFRSRYRGGDGMWRSSRFDRKFSADALFGKEITVHGRNLLGLNGRMILMGGRRRSPVDVPASLAREEVVFDHLRAFVDKEPDLLLFDVTLTYRRNHSRFSEVWALQVKNLLGAKEVLWDYNFETERVEEVKEGSPEPRRCACIARARGSRLRPSPRLRRQRAGPSSLRRDAHVPAQPFAVLGGLGSAGKEPARCKGSVVGLQLRDRAGGGGEGGIS